MLTNDKIKLIPMELEHVSLIKNWYNSYENTIYTTPYAFIPRNSYEENSWFERKTNDITCRYFMIETEETIVGFVAFTMLDLRNRTVKLSIVIGEKCFRGRGVAKLAIQLIEDYLIKEYDIRKIATNIFEGNVPSLKLFKSQGYFEEGKLVREIYRNKKYHNIVLVCKFFEE